jgi:RimJ/RimL family protein N-acetyltransferase
METERLLIRPLTPGDAPFIQRLLNEPSFLQHIGDKGVRTEEDAVAYLENGPMASYARHGHGLMAVMLKATGEPIGMCGLLKRDTLDLPDLGYAFLPEAWGRGYALEAGRAAMDQARRDRILAIVSQDNEASIKLLLKLGFEFVRLDAMYPDEPEVAVYAWSAE